MYHVTISEFEHKYIIVCLSVRVSSHGCTFSGKFVEVTTVWLGDENCMYAHVYARTCTHMYVHVYVRRTGVCTHMCMYAAQVYVRTCTHMCMYAAQVYVRHTGVCTHMYAQVYVRRTGVCTYA